MLLPMHDYLITDTEFNTICTYVKINFGLNFDMTKKSLVADRLSKLMGKQNMPDFKHFYDYILSDIKGTAISELVDGLTTHYTFFLREKEHLSFFKKVVLPYLRECTSKDRDLRIWSAGCSTGEEAYTLAFIINEYFSTKAHLWDTRILATDISHKVLDIAETGVYSKDNIDPLPTKWKELYFKEYDNNSVRIIDSIKNKIFFRTFNLIRENYIFKKSFQAIFCKNVLIYFDAQTKFEIQKKFYDILDYGGYLFLGQSEALNTDKLKFKNVLPSVYQKV